MKIKKIIIGIVLITVMAILCIMFFITREKTYSIRITIPAGSSEEFVYSDTEISPKNNKITITSGAGLSDCEIILNKIEVKEENAYKSTYLTHGMPVKMNVEKDNWFKIGVNIQNHTDEDIDVYLNVSNVYLRIE